MFDSDRHCVCGTFLPSPLSLTKTAVSFREASLFGTSIPLLSCLIYSTKVTRRLRPQDPFTSPQIHRRVSSFVVERGGPPNGGEGGPWVRLTHTRNAAAGQGQSFARGASAVTFALLQQKIPPPPAMPPCGGRPSRAHWVASFLHKPICTHPVFKLPANQFIRPRQLILLAPSCSPVPQRPSK